LTEEWGGGAIKLRFLTYLTLRSRSCPVGAPDLPHTEEQELPSIGVPDIPETEEQELPSRCP
jgi:hypothetical protein